MTQDCGDPPNSALCEYEGAKQVCPSEGGAPGRELSPSVITLSCDGKATSALVNDTQAPEAPEAVSKMGLVVNLAAQTVSGFGPVAHIDKIDAATITFSVGILAKDHASGMVGGQIDRITGAVIATTTMAAGAVLNYELFCKPTKRLF
jgi:hypothetical protein